MFGVSLFFSFRASKTARLAAETIPETPYKKPGHAFTVARNRAWSRGDAKNACKMSSYASGLRAGFAVGT